MSMILCASIPPCVNSFCFANNPISSSPPQLSNFDPVTEKEVRKTILSSTDSSYSLDLIPMKLLKSCIDSLTPPITHLINLSLIEGVFHTQFKQAIVKPFLKSLHYLRMICLAISNSNLQLKFHL